jgi:hypothetical protein
MSRRRHRQRGEEPEAVREWREWSDHQYNPGYWTGGKIPPFLKGKNRRLSRYAYVLVLMGFIGILFLASSIARARVDPAGAVIPATLALFSALLLLGTIALMRKGHR